MTYNNVNVLVTGGAKRIGKAISNDLAQHGFGVVVHANTSIEEAEELAQQIIEQGGKAWAVQGDLNAPATAAAIVADAANKAGSLQMLVNNASIFEHDAATELNEELWDEHFNVHLKSPAFMAQEFVARLGGNDGMIINIIDQRVRRLNPTFFSYTLSKSALWTATQTMAQALGPNIRVNAIAPGPALKNDRQNDEDFKQQVDALILQRSPALDEFGATIRYLWDAKSITGQMLALDGGQHLAWQTPDTNAKE